MSQRIMVIDDEIDFTHMVKLLLQMSGPYQVREVHSARAAVEMAREFQPDLILLDCMMPEMDGGEVAAQFESDPDLCKVPLIFLTATVSRPEEQSSRCYSGVRKYLPKPIQLASLIDTIQQALKSGAPTKDERDGSPGTGAQAAGAGLAADGHPGQPVPGPTG